MEVTLIDEALFDRVAALAKSSPRLRMNYNFHKREDEPVNRLLNVVNPGSYFPPHRHLNPDKQETCLVLRGSVRVILFDEAGRVSERIHVAPAAKVYGLEIPPSVWHTYLVDEENTVLFEVKQGPYAPLSADNLAPWAPPASDKEAVQAYLRRLEKSEE
jgi:cupin fold WbuC family metalloprotein